MLFNTKYSTVVHTRKSNFECMYVQLRLFIGSINIVDCTISVIKHNYDKLFIS